MATSQPLDTVSVVDAATSRLRDSLFAGEYAAAEEIKDTRIAREYGIARPTARIALQRLINEGMLVRPPGFSARVRSFDPEQVRDIYRVRRLIELDAVREILRSRPPLDGVALALDEFSDLRGGEDDWARIAEADVAFHSAVVEAGGSQRLRNVFSGITSEIRLLIALLKTQYTEGAALYEEHEELYRMLDAGGLGTADERHAVRIEEAWTAHLGSAQRFLEEYLTGAPQS